MDEASYAKSDWFDAVASAHVRIVTDDSVLEVYKDGRGILLDYGAEKYYGLDDVGAHVWKRLRQDERFPEIVKSVVDAFEIDMRTATADIASFISELHARGLVAIEERS